MKNSFLLYNDQQEIFNQLTDEDAGKLIKAIYDYQINGTNNLDGFLKIIFTQFKIFLDKDKQKYNKICEKNKINGQKGGRPKTQNNPTVILKTQNNPTKPKKADNDNDNDNDNDIIINNNNYKQIKDLYNETCVSLPKCTILTEIRKKAIRARLKTYSVEDFKNMFSIAEQCDFLKGKNSRNWIANFDWLIKDSNFAKVLEGNYLDKKIEPKQSDEYEDVSIGYIDKYGITVYASYPRKKGQTEWTEEERAKILKEVEGVRFLW